MLKRWTILLLMVALLVPGMLVQAQELPFKLAVRYQNGLYVVNGMPDAADVSAVLTQVHEPIGFYNDFRAVWSPDGTRLAYTVFEEAAMTASLMVWDGSQSFEVTPGNFLGDYPLAWTRDGRILYTSKILEADGMMTKSIAVYTVAPEAGATPDPVTENIDITEACGIGTQVPAQGAYWYEVVTQNSPLTLTDYGLIYPSICGGVINLYRPFAAETVTLGAEGLGSSVMLPDETQIAGLDVDYSGEEPVVKLVVIDLETLEATTIVTGERPGLLAWGKDGSLYYTTSTRVGSLLDGLTPKQLGLLNKMTMLDDVVDFDILPTYTVRLYRIAPDGTETLLVEPKAYAFGRLAVTDNAIIYSTIADGSAWLQAVLDGTLTRDLRYTDVEEELLPTTVSYLPINADGTIGDPVTLPGNLRRFAAR